MSAMSATTLVRQPKQPVAIQKNGPFPFRAGGAPTGMGGTGDAAAGPAGGAAGRAPAGGGGGGAALGGSTLGAGGGAEAGGLGAGGGGGGCASGLEWTTVASGSVAMVALASAATSPTISTR